MKMLVRTLLWFLVAVITLSFVLLVPNLLGGEVEECIRIAPKYGVPPEGIEVRLWDGSRADLVSETYVYEVDYAKKWQESFGQAGLYSILTGKPPAVILLASSTDDHRYLYRATLVSQLYGVPVFIEWLPQE